VQRLSAAGSFYFVRKGSEIVNINGTIKKLQTAILRAGVPIEINRSQFYSADQQRFIPVVSLSTNVYHYYPRLGVWKDQKFEIIRTSSQIDILQCLVDIYKAVSE
jgi:hypothetical protein